MALTLRPTGGPSRVYQHRQDWTIFDDGKPVGRIYEDTSASAPADLRWCWSIRTYEQPEHPGIRTSGRVPTLGQAKAEWLHSWSAWRKAQQRRSPKG
jgi:hypothetical protein